VEDDLVIAESIRRHFESWGCQTRCVSDFGIVLGEFADFDPQLVAAGHLPAPFSTATNGAAPSAASLRSPIIFLSSASDNMNIVMAMNLGGDDFIKKPSISRF
jgi:DNA-binding response OmpR family regulator